MKRLLVCALLLASCRTTRPAGEQPIASLPSSSREETERQLTQQREQFTGERSVARIRILTGTQTLSARTQLQVGAGGDMLMTVYAPVLNTTAARLYAANGRIVFLNDIDKTAWQGSASDFSGSFGFVGSNPAALALLILGLPPREGASIDYGAAGMQSARFQDMVVAYDPAVYPPRRVVIVRGMQRVEIDHLEQYVSPTSIPPLTVPSDYRCCVLPQL